MPIRLGRTNSLGQGNLNLAGQLYGIGGNLTSQAAQYEVDENLRERYGLTNALRYAQAAKLDAKKVSIMDRDLRSRDEQGWAQLGINTFNSVKGMFGGKAGMMSSMAGGGGGTQGGGNTGVRVRDTLDTSSGSAKSIPQDQTALPGRDPNAAVVMPGGGGKPGQMPNPRQQQGGQPQSSMLGGSRFANIIQEMRAKRASKSVLPYSLA